MESNGNGATETEKVKSIILDGAKKRFEARKEPAKPAEVAKAVKQYFAIDDEIASLESKILDAKIKRTQATQEIVALRGTEGIKTTSRGVGRVMARGETAWIVFPTAEGDAIDA